MVLGCVVAGAGAALLAYLVSGLPGTIGGSGRVAGVTFYGRRLVALGLIVTGCWWAYKAAKRL
jgi:hypothetical protein